MTDTNGATGAKGQDHATVAAEVRRDIDAICNIYRTVGDAMFEEPRVRLAERVATRIMAESAEGLVEALAIRERQLSFLAAALTRRDPNSTANNTFCTDAEFREAARHVDLVDPPAPTQTGESQ